MARDYKVELYNPAGEQIATIAGRNLFYLSLARRVSEVGNLKVELPISYMPLLQKDVLAEVYCSVNGGPWYLEGSTNFAIRSFGSTSNKKCRFTAFDGNRILTKRHVLYPAGSSQASKTGPADDMMKDIIDENFGASADASRNISNIFGRQAKIGLAPITSKSFAKRNVLEVLKDLADTATVAGTHLTFDTVVIEAGKRKLEFRTYTGQRGNDLQRRNGNGEPLILSEDTGTISEPSLDFDYTQSKSYAFVAGQGEGVNRATGVASDASLIATSPEGLDEIFVDARQTENANALTGEAQATLRERRPRVIFRANLEQTPSQQYGREYYWGDRVSAYYANRFINCIIEMVEIEAVDGDTTIKASIQGQDVI